MAIVTARYSSEFMELINGVPTNQTTRYTIQTDNETHDVDAKTFAETNLGDDVEVTTVVTVTKTAPVAQVAEPMTLGSGATSVA